MEQLRAEDPQWIGQFRLLGRLGSGGMGRVYLGRGPYGAAVAVKVVHPELLETVETEFRFRFAREVRAARAVDAAFAARVVDADPDAEVPWLATEFVPGLPLGEAVARFGPLPAASLWDLAAGLLTALAGVHEAGLVHRDVKPSNIMLAADGPKLIDFGIARLAGATGVTRTAQTVGTWGFMAPEQFERSDVGPESDVFSAGAVLAYAGTGRPPFPGDSLPVLFTNVTTREPDLGGLPAALLPLVTALLTKAPGARPSVAQARAMLPASATRVGGDTSWLPAPLTHAILEVATTALHAPAPAAHDIPTARPHAPQAWPAPPPTPPPFPNQRWTPASDHRPSRLGRVRTPIAAIAAVVLCAAAGVGIWAAVHDGGNDGQVQAVDASDSSLPPLAEQKQGRTPASATPSASLPGAAESCAADMCEADHPCSAVSAGMAAQWNLSDGLTNDADDGSVRSCAWLLSDSAGDATAAINLSYLDRDTPVEPPPTPVSVPGVPSAQEVANANACVVKWRTPSGGGVMVHVKRIAQGPDGGLCGVARDFATAVVSKAPQ